MKNNILKFFLIFLFYSCAHAEQFTFKTSVIEMKENGNVITASDGKVISQDKNLEIEAKNFNYNKKLGVLVASKNGNALIKSKKIRIEFDELTVDEKNLIIEAKGNVKIYEDKKNFLIKTEILTLDKKTNILKSSSPSILKDNFKNIVKTSEFNYNIDKNILKILNADILDKKGNSYSIKSAFINTKTNKLFGKDVSVELTDKAFNDGNKPRLKGKTINYDTFSTEIKKGVFTTCRETDTCPPWMITSKKITHNKEKKTIYYENAWLKLYNIPVLYFPKFFHPDPTVKRKSGLLVPSITNSNSATFLSVPYFFAIAQNKDMTFTPRFYNNDKFLIQTEFRQENIDGSHIADLSFLSENNVGSKNHLFYNYDKSLGLSIFDESKLKLKIQQTSNNTYLKKNNLKSEIIDDFDVLENSLTFNFYSDDLSIDAKAITYESLNKENSSDKYEFIFPNINLIKKIENTTPLDGDFIFTSNNLFRNYQTNIFEKTNINDLIFNSNPKVSKLGLYNNYDFIIKNLNSDSSNSENYKEDQNHYLSGTLQFNSSLPLKKETSNYQKILKPKLSLKISPNDTKKINDNDNRIDVNNIYSLNRLSVNDTLEGGSSLAFGSEYSILDKYQAKEIFGLKIANNVRFDENRDLPTNSQIGEKTSNFFGEILYSPNDYLTTKYNTSAKNNLTQTSYENFTSQIKINNFITSFDYLNENDTTEKNSYLQNTTSYSLNDTSSIVFSTRENKTSNLTEFYNFMYQYKSDCLAASLEYNKNYYNDRDIKAEESLFFKLSIIPLGETSSPNIKN